MVWFNKASDLHASAGALWMSMREDYSDIFAAELGFASQFNMSVAVWPVYMMLCGLSLELLYKAISVAKGEEVKPIHDLIQLANLAGIKTEGQSKKLLALLTESIIWEGKYPAPKDKRRESFSTANNLYNQVMYTKCQHKGIERQKPTDALSWNSFNKLWVKASKIFWENRS